MENEKEHLKHYDCYLFTKDWVGFKEKNKIDLSIILSIIYFIQFLLVFYHQNEEHSIKSRGGVILFFFILKRLFNGFAYY